ncbi:MAG: DUF2892 domain-containing protein [Syntrophothermus sp.]
MEKSDNIFNTVKKNLGRTDAIIRLAITAVIVVLFITGVISGTAGIILLIVGGILTLTSLVGFCPIWAMLGINTRTRRS